MLGPQGQLGCIIPGQMGMLSPQAITIMTYTIIPQRGALGFQGQPHCTIPRQMRVLGPQDQPGCTIIEQMVVLEPPRLEGLYHSRRRGY